MRTDLVKAAGCYAQVHDLMWDMWNCVGGNGRSAKQVECFADPQVRRRLVQLIYKGEGPGRASHQAYQGCPSRFAIDGPPIDSLKECRVCYFHRSIRFHDV